MTKRTCLCFDLEDIHLVHFECKGCGARFSIRAAAWDKNAAICGNCKEPFIKPGSVEERAVNSIRQGISDLLRFRQNLTFRIRFEVPIDPPNSESAEEESAPSPGKKN